MRTPPYAPFKPDDNTVALYHFDEGEGNEAKDACGDTGLTLRAQRAGQWGSHAGFGACARFDRRADDANLLVGPTNNDKLQLRSCTSEWTIEAWVRYKGAGGLEEGHTYVNICGTEDEGLGLPTGIRGGWNFSLSSFTRPGTLQDGLVPAARFMGSPRGRDPNHDTSGLLFPHSKAGGWTSADPPRIRDHEWHHVAWQFRFLDQTHFFFLDGQLIRRVQLPLPNDIQGRVVNDTEDVGVPFVVGGFLHSQDPPKLLGFGNFDGEIDEVRISRIMRYPVAERLAIVGRELPAATRDAPYSVQIPTDAARGAVVWELAEGRLPEGLTLDGRAGTISGRPTAAVEEQRLGLLATDASGCSVRRQFQLSVRRGRIATGSLPPAFAGNAYRARIVTVHMVAPVEWTVVEGVLPGGLQLDRDTGALVGTPFSPGNSRLRVEAVDATGQSQQAEFVLKVLPAELLVIGPDEHTVVLYDWQGPNGRLIRDVMGDEELTLTWTNIGGDRRVSWPGRAGRFPQDTGHGEHGFVGPQGNDKLDLRSCKEAWTVEAWIRRGGPLQAYGERADAHHRPFTFGHICGTYDKTERGVWEFYLSAENSPDGSMAPGVHFLGAEPDQALMDLHPWTRPEGLVAGRAEAGISDIEWHHAAWQYEAGEDIHQLFLDGVLIWQMRSPDGRRLVNNRRHGAQFSVSTRLKGFARYGGAFDFLGEGHFFGQIGEIRISSIKRY